MGQSFRELEAGDLRHASEKGWGAAAQMIKAVAAERGLPHDSHRLLYGFAGRLANETQGQAIGDGFRAASNLHENFYEGMLDAAAVENNLERVRAFVEVAEGLLNGL